MKTLDIATGIVFLVLSGVIAIGTWHLPYWSDFAPGPAFASFWVAGLGALIGVLLLIETLRETEHDPADWPDRRGAVRVLSAVGALWLFLAVLPVLGFTLSALLFMLTMLLVVQRRRLVPALFTTVLTVGLAQSIFGLWLAIDLPKGLVGF